MAACLAALRDNSEHVRVAAIKCLGSVVREVSSSSNMRKCITDGACEYRDTLVKMLADRAKVVRQEAAQCLHSILENGPDDDMIEAIADLVQHHSDHAVRGAALKVLGRAVANVPGTHAVGKDSEVHHVTPHTRVTKINLHKILANVMAQKDDELQTLVRNDEPLLPQWHMC